jgi:tRNA threonylcarbamoyladenosine biosynthesis protein TsaB
MRVLLIDTCGAVGSVALADSAREPAIVASATLPGRTASERLVATVREMAASSAVELQSLDALGVVSGPGSFTGVRVGLSAAKGLCEALGVPLVAVSRLAVLARLAEAPSGARVHALLDAGRGEFYWGMYVDGERVREATLTRDEVFAAVDFGVAKGDGARDVVVTCENAVAQSVAGLLPRLVAEPSAGDAWPLVLSRIERADFDDVATIDANYLRRTDAEIFAKPQAGVAKPETRVR